MAIDYIIKVCFVGLYFCTTVSAGPTDSGSDSAESECNGPLDVIYVVDSSISVTPEEWSNVKRFMKDVSDQLNIGLKPGQTRVGLVQYGSETVREWHLNDEETSSNNRLRKEIDKLKPLATLSHTTSALQEARLMILEESSKRSDVPNVVIVISDGLTNVGLDNLTDTVNELKKIPLTTVFAVDSSTNHNDLATAEHELLASTRGYIYELKNRRADGQVARDLDLISCYKPTVTPVQEQSTQGMALVTKTETYNLSLGLILGIVFGLLVFAVCCIVCCCYCVKIRKPKNKAQQMFSRQASGHTNRGVSNSLPIRQNLDNEMRNNSNQLQNVYEDLEPRFLMKKPDYADLNKLGKNTVDLKQIYSAIDDLRAKANHYTTIDDIVIGEDKKIDGSEEKSTSGSKQNATGSGDIIAVSHALQVIHHYIDLLIDTNDNSDNSDNSAVLSDKEGSDNTGGDDVTVYEEIENCSMNPRAVEHS